MLSYQDMAYCRWLFVWTFLFIFNVVSFSPLLSLLIVFIVELFAKKSYMSSDKRYGILLSELYVIIAILIKSKKLYLLENIFVFILYAGMIRMLGTDVETLHKVQLKNDDIIHSNEYYWEYLGRIWYSFIVN